MRKSVVMAGEVKVMEWIGRCSCRTTHELAGRVQGEGSDIWKTDWISKLVGELGVDSGGC